MATILLSDELKKFLKENKTIINENSIDSWEYIYDLFESMDDDTDMFTLPGEFTSAMLSIGVDPVKVLEIVPRRFLKFQKQITTYKIPNNCKYIGMGAFEDTSISQIDIPNTVTGIDYLAFSGTKLTKIELPDSITLLENAVFYRCNLLREVNLGSVKYLGNQIFSGCINLNKVILPNTIIYISLDCFHGCNALKEIIYKGTKEEFKNMVTDELEDWVHNYNIICSDGVIKID